MGSWQLLLTGLHSRHSITGMCLWLCTCRWFFQQLILAVDYCHKKGVANRDIKLENTLLAVSGCKAAAHAAQRPAGRCTDCADRFQHQGSWTLIVVAVAAGAASILLAQTLDARVENQV